MKLSAKTMRRECLAIFGASIKAFGGQRLPDAWRNIAAGTDGMVGTAALRLGSSGLSALNGNEPFPLASVCKLPIAMNMLALAAKLPGLCRYHQNYVVDREQRGIQYARGAYEFDGIAELWFEDLPSMNEAFASEEAQRTLADEGNFVASIAAITAVQHVVIPDASDLPLIKRMSTLRRKPDISSELFKSEWFDIHSVLVRRLAQVKGYTQNLVFDRTDSGRPAPYERLSIDGIVELWFEHVESLNEGFTSPGYGGRRSSQPRRSRLHFYAAGRLCRL
jgi:uncharacterized protein (TIGR02118 family)